ncbi:hypothetical protein B7494_g6058 [Chlorociboria aeruginascens]|nr:hypothetical protein B7494_g6058 [Chlorociboria aeruginascens]
MAVTELASIPLIHSISKDESLPPSLIQKLQTAKAVLESEAGCPFYYFQQIENPSTIYILGKWDSVEAHNRFLPSAENQTLLQLLKDDIIGAGEVKMQMWHLDADIFGPDNSDSDKPVLMAPVVSCNRHFVSAEKREAFRQKFAEVRGLLADFTQPYHVVGGWRIEKELDGQGQEREEWVLFSGFKSVDAHMGFAKTEEFTKYKEILEFLEGFDIKHLKRIAGL